MSEGKKFAHCKDREGCGDYYTKEEFENLKPAENYFRELKDCTPEKCVKRGQCYESSGCGDFYSAMPTDKLPQGVFKTEDAEKCKTECKKYVQCHETEGCKDFWSALPADQLPKNVFPTLEECQKKCKEVYKCKCQGQCNKSYSTDPQQPFFLTKTDCQQSKDCFDTPCKELASFERKWTTLIVFCVVVVLAIVAVVYNFLSTYGDPKITLAMASFFVIVMGAWTAYWYGSGEYLRADLGVDPIAAAKSSRRYYRR